MHMAQRVSKFVAFLRGGYPTWMPVTGYVPLVALSRRRLSDDEINTLTSELIAHHRRPITTADVGVAITRVTQEMPSLDDIDRVKCLLVRH
ncbi:DUF3349 domain-containing protein [Mycobacterium riyadhense]|uniref:DUF3349 domain-containing protein n=1 Tax=Mycobacterium riyadhense TaxID=486698 RepID=UPI00195A765C|nr:DUF3349 domain-containing protein [Mycobacterium riyadhense]